MRRKLRSLSRLWGGMATALSILCLLAPLARAQDDFPASPPPDLPVRPVVLPKTETRTLTNGLKIIVAETHRVPLVTMRLAVPAGSVLDPPDSPGLAAAVANQLTAGTGMLTSFQLRVAAEKLGGSVSASAGQDFATVSATGLGENFPLLAELMATVLRHPGFPDSELNIYKGMTVQNLLVQRQNPAFLAQEQFNHILFGAHPYGISSTTPAALQGLTHEKLAAFYKARYTPNGAVLVVVGDVKPAAVFAAVQKSLGQWAGPTEMTPVTYPAPPSRDARRIYLVARPGSVQSNILFGNLAIKRSDPDYYSLLVANFILGGGSASRLFANVREKQGFAYDVRSTPGYDALAGTFSESAQTRTAVTTAALKEMFQETERIRTQPVSEAELQSAKSFLAGNFISTLASQAGLTASLLNIELYHLPADYLIAYREKIKAITAADVQRAAQKYMLSDKAAVVIVGDADQLRDSLKEIGEIEEVK